MKKYQTIIGATPFGPDLLAGLGSSLGSDVQGFTAAPVSLADETPDDAGDGAAETVASEWRVFVIPAELHGQRLDRALADLVPEFSRSYLQQLVGEAAVRLNGQPVLRNAQKVTVGQTGEVELRATPRARPSFPSRWTSWWSMKTRTCW